MQRSLLTLSAAFALALTACGGDDGGGPSTASIEDPATVMQGKATGDQSSALTAIPAGADESSAQAPITQVGQAIQAFASQHQAFKAMQQASGLQAAPTGLQAEPGALGALQQAQTAQTFSYEDGHLQADVTYDSGQAAVLYQVDLQIDAADPGYVMDGTFNLEFAVSQGMYDVAYDYDAVYDALTFDGAGCPTSGRIQVDYAFSVSGDFINQLPAEARAQIENQVAGNGRVVASFGPACGDVSVEGS